MDDSSQLRGGAGPAGSLRPLASRRRRRRGLGVGVSGMERSWRMGGGIVGVVLVGATIFAGPAWERRRVVKRSLTEGASSLPDMSQWLSRFLPYNRNDRKLCVEGESSHGLGSLWLMIDGALYWEVSCIGLDVVFWA